jgi:hypothetical protein
MKKPGIIIFLLLFSSFLLLKAQDIKKSPSQPDSLIKVIPFGAGRHTYYLYNVGGKLQTREDVAIRLLAYAPSAAEYHKAKNNSTWVFISCGGFVASSIGATIEFANNNKQGGGTPAIVNGQPGFIYQHKTLTGAYFFTGAATAFLVSSIINLSKAAFHSNNSIKLYNQRFE